MDEKLRQLLNEVPERSSRSKLEPYVDVIRELRKKRRTYREIAAFLQEHVPLSIAPSTIHDFVKRRSRPARQRVVMEPDLSVVTPTETRSEATPQAPGSTPSADEIRERLRALKQQLVEASQEPKRFTFDPVEPLTLDPKRKET